MVLLNPHLEPVWQDPGVSLRSAPLERDITLPDGRLVRIRIGLAEDSYIPASALDTVTLELYGDGEHLAAVTTILDADQDREARALLREVAAGLEAGTLAPNAGALEPLADSLR
jgi:hypothetical protein